MKWILYLLIIVSTQTINAQEADSKTKLFDDNIYSNHVIDLKIISDFNIGDQWFFETDEYIGGGNGRIAYKRSVITDQLIHNGTIKYIINEIDTFYTIDRKMYFWDNYFNEYIMYYDFANTSAYTIAYWDQFLEEEQIATIQIDSTSSLLINNDTIMVQHAKVINSGTLDPYFIDIYEGIGTNLYGYKFILGCGLCDDNPVTTKLRCFSNENESYNFVGYNCDSTWLISSTEDINSNQISIFPNPTVSKIFISGIDREVDYKVYSAIGNQVSYGITKNRTIELKDKGIYIVSLKIGERWISRKIIKME